MGYTIDSLVEEARSELLIPLPGAAFAKSRGSLRKVSEQANSNLREVRRPALFTPRRRRYKASPRRRRVPEPSIPTVRVAVRGSRDQVIDGPFHQLLEPRPWLSLVQRPGPRLFRRSMCLRGEGRLRWRLRVELRENVP